MFWEGGRVGQRERSRPDSARTDKDLFKDVPGCGRSLTTYNRYNDSHLFVPCTPAFNRFEH